MNILLIVAVAAVLIVAVIAGVSALNESKAEKISCSECGNSCNAETNCGLPTCGAVNSGGCGCGR